MDNIESTTFLYNEKLKTKYPLLARIITIGTAPECTIRLKPPGPLHTAHCLFSKGSYHFQPLTDAVSVLINGNKTTCKHRLSKGDTIKIGTTELTFVNNEQTETACKSVSDPLDELIEMVLLLLQNRDRDITSSLMTIISRLLQCDAARIVSDDEKTGNRFTLIRYPEHVGLDRFSNRAIDWAQKASRTILMLEPDWTGTSESQSLELNSVASILCAPLHCGDDLKGYLYLDRVRSHDNFTDEDRGFCDRLLPLFSEILANSEERKRQSEMITLLQNAQENDNSGIVYRSKCMKDLIALADRIAPSDSPVLVMGETGTGKELMARRLHLNSLRKGNNFKAINCGAIPENLIESELFGHEKGAFTGAYARKKGLFESANGGTVFLDEIGEMPLSLQVKLLRVLQESEVVPVGGTATIKVNVRIIAATNKKLSNEVQSNNFRSDLFFRLNVLSITIPPLRERSEDILLLAEYFLDKYCSRIGQKKKILLPDAQQFLASKAWPGNVRELENAINKAVIMSTSGKLGRSDFEICSDVNTESSDNKDSIPTMQSAREMAEIEVVHRALRATMGNVSQVSKILEVDRKWLLIKISKYGINANEYRNNNQS